jgi:pyruvate dehydrogenase E2 component (dihydrolipoamide acetyltransferase)
MPRLGWDMQVGSVAEWLKRDGERVEVGEPICMIAADKGTVELEAPGGGILHLSPRSPEPGVDVPVGTLLAYLLEPGEEIPREAAHGELVEPPDKTQDERVPRRIVASPRARRAAVGLGVDWRTLAGSGRGGRILERDVARASATMPYGGDAHEESGVGAQPATQAATAAGPLPLSGIRRLTAERVSLSARTVAPVTLTTEANATTLVRLREQALAEHGAAEGVPSVTDLLIKLVAVALGEHPALNAELTQDGIVQHAQVNVGIAVDTEAGLVAPVVRNVGARSLESIARESTRLIEAARTRTSRPADLMGATFTITNLGMYEIDAFTPIVNLPQCAILGVGRIILKPIVIDATTEQVGVQRMLTLSLTFDHRLVDGAPAARFLQRIKHLVERPTLWLFR